MEIVLLKLFDKIIPNYLKWDSKEMFRSIEYYKYNFLKNGNEVFSRIDVETNTDCNRTCSICPCSISPKPCAKMPLELYKTLLSQLADMRFKGRLSPVFYNEPTLDKRLPDLMRMAREALPNAYLTLYTNGSLLTRQKITELLDSGMDGIYVSQYEENLPVDDVSKILRDLPPSTRKRIRYRVLTNDIPLSTRGGLVGVKKPISKKFCFQASTDAVVDHEGNVVLCCNDYYARYVFGNIQDEHIKKIWNKPEFKSVRKQLRRGRFKEEMCRSCAGLN